MPAHACAVEKVQLFQQQNAGQFWSVTVTALSNQMKSNFSGEWQRATFGGFQTVSWIVLSDFTNARGDALASSYVYSIMHSS